MSRGRTLGILGYGSIGREIARLAKNLFGLKILVTKRDAKKLTDEEYTVPGTGDPQTNYQIVFTPLKKPALYSVNVITPLSPSPLRPKPTTCLMKICSAP